MTDEPPRLAGRADLGRRVARGVPHLGRRLEDLRERLTWADALLVCLDFDGTLAPIVSDPAGAEPLSASLAALERLRDHPAVSVAVVSGRALADVRRRVDLAGVHYAGNHGLEFERDGERSVHPAAAEARPALSDALESLREELADVSGLLCEDKGVTATVHYRQSPPEQTAAIRDAVATAVDERPALRLTEGKQVLELRPDVAADKGTAVRVLLEDHDGHLPVYVGDDRTDEAAFRALSPVGVGVHVGDGTETAAAYRVADPAEVAALLGWLAAAGTELLERETRTE